MICVPWMLCFKPFMLDKLHAKEKQEGADHSAIEMEERKEPLLPKEDKPQKEETRLKIVTRTISLICIGTS